MKVDQSGKKCSVVMETVDCVLYARGVRLYMQNRRGFINVAEVTRTAETGSDTINENLFCRNIFFNSDK